MSSAEDWSGAALEGATDAHRRSFAAASPERRMPWLDEALALACAARAAGGLRPRLNRGSWLGGLSWDSTASG